MTEEIIETPVSGPYFRFTNEAAWIAEAEAAGFFVTFVTEPETGAKTLQAYTSDHAIDVIGIISEGGKWDADGNEIEAPTVLSGWHINALGSLPDWKEFEVFPNSPYRIFFN